MLAIHYCRQDQRTRRHTTEHLEIAIGSDAGNELVLADPTVSERHCRILAVDGTWLIEDLGSATGTVIHGKRIRRPEVVGESDRIYIGAFVVELEAIDGRIGPVEEGLLDRIARGDDDSRAIYADWLEERGDLVRAEFVRLQQVLIDAPMTTAPERLAVHTALQRVHELAGSIDPGWRTRVARPAVDGCRISCRKDWGALELTGDPGVRACNTCRKQVHHCATEEEAIERLSRGLRVVLDIRLCSVACGICGSRNLRGSAVCAGCSAMLVEAGSIQRMQRGCGLSARGSEPPSRFAGGVDAATQAPTARVCSGCGEVNAAFYRFCLGCGRPMVP